MPAQRKCVVDATLYDYCPRCGSKDDATQTWRVNFCSENCREIYKTVNAYTHKKITVGQAKAELSKLDTVKLPDYADAIKVAIVEIMADSTAPIVETPVVEEPIMVEETPVEDAIEETESEIIEEIITEDKVEVEEETTSEQPYFRKKKRK